MNYLNLKKGYETEEEMKIFNSGKQYEFRKESFNKFGKDTILEDDKLALSEDNQNVKRNSGHYHILAK